MANEVVLGAVFAVFVCLSKVLLGVMTPLYLDCLTQDVRAISNISNTSSINPDTVLNLTTPVWQRIDPFFGIWLSMGFDTLLFGLVVLCLYYSGKITERETNYPKTGLVLSGSAQAVSALLYQFSTSGSKTPPYLQGSLGYFYIPIAFTLRFFILHKRPTIRKLVCAVIIFVGEFVSLIPTMFPQLENSEAHAWEGGATGVGRILWPMVFVMSSFPHAIWNILLEKGSKDKSSTDGFDLQRLNMAYVMFWNFSGTFTTALFLFWIDLIPGFGFMPNIHLFFHQFWFNVKCIFGATEVCGFYQVFTAWGRIISKTSMFVLSGLLVRYGEGANFYAIITAVSTPMIFLVFTLFNEQTVEWDPRATLSTWLCVGVLAVMLPVVVLYNTGPPEITVPPKDTTPLITDVDDEDEPMLEEPRLAASVNTAHMDVQT